VVMPIIDGLSREFKYSPGGVELVGFNTRLVDHGIALQKIHQFEGRTAVDPEPSPAMAGGLFSVHREYFFEIGTRALSRCRCCFCCCYFFCCFCCCCFCCCCCCCCYYYSHSRSHHCHAILLIQHHRLLLRSQFQSSPPPTISSTCRHPPLQVLSTRTWSTGVSSKVKCP
jgi:hypothetical protein